MKYRITKYKDLIICSYLYKNLKYWLNIKYKENFKKILSTLEERVKLKTRVRILVEARMFLSN